MTLTQQEIFDTAYKAIVAQGGPALNPDEGICCYLDPTTGNRCAIGHLLPENLARSWDTRKIAASDLRHDSDLADALLKRANIDVETISAEFLIRLQDAHDSEVSIPNPPPYLNAFRRRMHDLAADYNLNTEALS